MQLTGVENPESGEAIRTFGFVMKHSVRTFTYATLNKRHELCPYNLTPLPDRRTPQGPFSLNSYLVGFYFILFYHLWRGIQIVEVIMPRPNSFS